MILGQNLKFLQNFYIVKLELEIMFGSVLEWNESDSDDIWGYQIQSAAILDIFSKGLGYDYGWKLQISSKFVDSQIGPRIYFSWCSRVKLKWSWRYMRISNLISRHLGFFSKGVSLWSWVKISNFFRIFI